jgi:hypothetical protein
MGKIPYQTRNWSSYNEGLKKRGSLTVWLSPDVEEQWYDLEDRNGRGNDRKYSDYAIETMATMQALLKLPGRQTEGFLGSLFTLMGVNLAVPEHSTLCRRMAKLSVNLNIPHKSEGCHVVIDSTGLKVYGEGEWKVRQHGKEKRRTWRKLHLCIDESTHEILSAELTTSEVHDCECVDWVFEEAALSRSNIVQASGDGAYDQHATYDSIEDHTQHNATITIPPRSNAVLAEERDNPNLPFNEQRNNNVELVNRLGAKEWKEQFGYHRRSIAETGMHRFKKIHGGGLARITLARQRSEVRIKCRMLNQMIEIARPISVPVAL